MLVAWRSDRFAPEDDLRPPNCFRRGTGVQSNVKHTTAQRYGFFLGGTICKVNNLKSECSFFLKQLNDHVFILSRNV